MGLMKARRRKCDICNARFVQQFHLNTHVSRVHDGKRAFKCESCSAEFKSKQGMERHIATTHESKKEKIDICEPKSATSPPQWDTAGTHGTFDKHTWKTNWHSHFLASPPAQPTPPP